ncbi:MAG: hypothetical protein ACI9G1_000173 [Pirellulaceae bacterium]|jgi:uncharacterized protein (UPF0261 family)
MSKSILLIGAFDTKGAEYAFLREQILGMGESVISVNSGIMGTTDLFPLDIEADQVLAAAGHDIGAIRQANDRGAAIKAMAAGAAVIAKKLYDDGAIDAVIGMGGSGGSTVVTAAMRALPVGVPKICVSTVAATDTSPYVGDKDVTLIPSITDVSGVNRISRIIFTRAAGAVCGMKRAELPIVADDRPIVAASMFGNTTKCVDACREILNQHGYEVLVFHATGTGGRTMETLIDEGLVDACLDITTTEWADEICGGVLSAGKDRLSAPGRAGIPHLIVPGCIDMANFGPIDSVPQQFRNGSRNLYEWNPAVTLMRTNVEENLEMGKVFAEKANAAQGPTAFLLPLNGVSILDGDGERFCDRVADQAMFDSLKQNLNDTIHVQEIEANINDREFAEQAVAMLLSLIATHKNAKK